MSAQPTDALVRALAEAEARGLSPASDGDHLRRLALEHGVPFDDLCDALAAAALLTGTQPDPSVVWRGALQALGTYEVGPELGRGGMGVVYRAHQRSLGRDVALKVLVPGELLFGEALARFEREARALAKLKHPYIVPIHEVGRAGDVAYYAMDLYEGGSLADLLRKNARPMPIARCVRLVHQIAEALAHVHAHGLVHRDLKPANILLDAAGDAHLADFGLAVDPAEGATLTKPGHLLGTPDYMAPEQARGERARIDERTDVYALGVMLYECLVGRRPFEGRGFFDKVHAVVHTEPPAPRALRREIPRALERIVQQAMAKSPERRYATASAMAADLARFSAGELVTARGLTAFERVLGMARRRRGALLGACAVALVAAAGYLGWSWQRDTALETLQLAQQLTREGEQRAADLVHLRALKRLEGRPLGDDAERELALEGVASIFRSHASAPRAERTERRAELERHVTWLQRELGARHPGARLAEGALARIGDDAGAALQRWQATSSAALRLELERESDRVAAAQRELLALSPYLQRPGHPYLLPAALLAERLLGALPAEAVPRSLGPWCHAALALVEHAPSIWPGSVPDFAYDADADPLSRLLAGERRSPALLQGLAELLADDAADHAVHVAAARCAARALDYPPLVLLLPQEAEAPDWDAARARRELGLEWRRAFGVDVPPALDAELAVLVFDGPDGAARVAASTSTSVSFAEARAVALEFAVADSGSARVEVTLQQREHQGALGIAADVVVLGPSGRVPGVTAATGILPHGFAHVLADIEVPTGRRTRQVQPAVRALLVVATREPLHTEGADEPQWGERLLASAAHFAGPEANVTTAERRDFWRSPTPLGLARLVRGLDSADMRLPEPFETGLSARSWSSDEVLAVRGLELALGRFDTTAVATQMQTLTSGRAEERPLLLPNAGELLSHPSAEVRRFAAARAVPTRITAAELERGAAAFRAAGEELPPHLAACLARPSWGERGAGLVEWMTGSRGLLAALVAMLAGIALWLYRRGRRSSA